MKLKVPFVRTPKYYKDKKIGICGPVALKSILSYYGVKASMGEVVKGSGMPKKGGTSIFGLAYFCLKNSLKVDYYSFNEIDKWGKSSKRIKDFVKKYNLVNNDKKFLSKCRKFDNFNSVRKKPAIKLIESFIDKKMPVLILFNVISLFGKDNPDLPWGSHYTVVVGYDKNNFYIHNNSWPKNEAYLKANKRHFMKTASSEGYSGEMLVISN